MKTVKDIMEALSKYPETMELINEKGEEFIHVVNNQNDTVILSTSIKEGCCNSCGDYVYKEKEVKQYPYFCPTCNENKFEFEITKL